MAAVISLMGIDEAISNLNYQNPKILKCRLVHAIRDFYEKEPSVESLHGIDTEELIKALWDTGNDPAIIKAKRKNLSSIKSSVNGDLRRLYNDGKNPDGINIGRNNIFVMSDEAKDKLLTTFSTVAGGVLSLGQIAEVLNVVNEVLSNAEALADAKSPDGQIKFEELRRAIQGLLEKLSAGAEQPEEVEEIDEAEVEEVLEEVEVDDAVEEVVEEEGLDEAEVEEVLEEVEVDDAVEEVVEEEGLDEVEVEEGLEEVEVDEDYEEAEEDEGLEDVDADDAVEEVEVIEGSQELGLPVGSLGGEYSDDAYEGDDKTREYMLLAETFDGYLGVMERFYNQYILIPEGEYIVGAKAPKRDELPEHRVRLAPFYMGRFPVTNALFEIFVEKTGYRTTAEKLGYGTVYYGRFSESVEEETGLVKLTFNAAVRCKTVYGACWYQPFGPGSTLHNKRNHPVVQISLEDAMAFAAWTGKRLPTENEWEVAARTSDGHVFPWGNEWKGDSCNIEESSVADATPVDRYVEFVNDFGIVDTLGNVMEWTLDTCESPHHAKSGSKYHIAKGGSWISGNDIRLFSRFKVDPASHSNLLGFRCVAY